MRGMQRWLWQAFYITIVAYSSVPLRAGSQGRCDNFAARTKLDLFSEPLAPQ